MNIEEDIKNLKTYIELVIEKNYCDCNELNTICYGKYGDGSKNVAKSIENVLIAYEKEKETSHYIQSQLDIANAKLVEEKEKNKELEDTLKCTQNSWYEDTKVIDKQSKEIEELKDESKEYQIGFAQGCYEKDLDWEDKIKAKIEEVDKEEKEQLKGTKGQDRYAIKQEYMHKRSGLQSLLEKE